MIETKQSSYIPALDGIRALSILLVFAGHQGFDKIIPVVWALPFSSFSVVFSSPTSCLPSTGRPVVSAFGIFTSAGYFGFILPSCSC
jgi:peptidoglycan/LPS O-acetylase OafA/YrhL